jgi:hypothetical protein
MTRKSLDDLRSTMTKILQTKVPELRQPRTLIRFLEIPPLQDHPTP